MARSFVRLGTRSATRDDRRRAVFRSRPWSALGESRAPRSVLRAARLHVSSTRGFAVPTRTMVLEEIGPRGSSYVGSPETVAQKIAANLRALGASRFDVKYGMGRLPHDVLMTDLVLLGTKVAPRVRELLPAV